MRTQIKLTRRSFLGTTASAMMATPALIQRATSADAIPGFDQTKTNYDRTKVWKPFSDRKIRVGLVGFVATDAPSHARHCIEVLNHGKHVCTAVPAFYGDRVPSYWPFNQCRRGQM
ncbi:MAG TPA: hypothetical protein P5555_19870 [Candidatus Paceibacterota bacterium]|nr:hypothetical protein [Candidatus Paceibacterota bacterium]HRZ58453.1 hypothetical protein [Candidatus Paceibacterota bacterium]